MNTEASRLTDPHARQFHGYQGDQPIHLGPNVHIDAFDDGRHFVAVGDPESLPAKVYVNPDELIAAARAVLRHFEVTT